MSTAELARALRRFAPSTLDDSAWLGLVDRAVVEARAAGLLDANNTAKGADLLGAITEGKPRPTWAQLADKLLPALSLGIAPTDAKTLARLKDRDTWTAAIAARLLGQWREGPPPSLSAVCDAYAWQQLGLAGQPKRMPHEVRALFLQRELQTQSAPPDRLLRLYVARELGAARPELRVLRDALVRRWLGGVAGASAAAPVAPRSESFASLASRPRAQASAALEDPCVAVHARQHERATVAPAADPVDGGSHPRGA